MKNRGQTNGCPVRTDYARPDAAAPLRGGASWFVFARLGSLADQGKLISANHYHSIPDQQYIDDPALAPRTGSETMTWPMQAVYHGRAAREGIFHIHLTAQRRDGMSNVDSDEIPKLIPGFQSVGRRQRTESSF